MFGDKLLLDTRPLKQEKIPVDSAFRYTEGFFPPKEYISPDF